MVILLNYFLNGPQKTTCSLFFSLLNFGFLLIFFWNFKFLIAQCLEPSITWTSDWRNTLCILASGALVKHTWSIFDLVVFKAILGSFGELFSNWSLIRKWLTAVQTSENVGLGGTSNIYGTFHLKVVYVIMWLFSALVLNLAARNICGTVFDEISYPTCCCHQAECHRPWAACSRYFYVNGQNIKKNW